MSLLEFFRPQKKTSANLAKERLQIIVAERRDRVRLLQNELSQFIAASEGRDLTEFNRISVPRRPHQQERSLE